MLKAFIVDDEPLARDELTYILHRTKRVEVVGEAESIDEALRHIRQSTPDVVFLDIQLVEETGLELARQLQGLDRRPEIVFATAYDEYALKAFELNAIDYILKPYDEVRIQQTVDKIAKLQETRGGDQAMAAFRPSAAPERTGKLAVTVEERIILVNISQILYIASEEGKTLLVTDAQTYKVGEPLVVFEHKLQGGLIVRVHRAYLVNVDAIVEIQPWFHSTFTLIMKNGSKVPVSRTYMKELKQLLGL
ncbi:LytTR family transcriptional regulator DNA-binding domain-containing protein [Paenibacillus sp. LHD-117]|uniref:LytR/AlgR family response regulator transcription factor n=1 Tax=Paenibacillus sp. LHD-117 TaxID=3071412 RepID=UPI0027E04695|nr:LytTR family transcriptional regulator DNA-binding domain-containing protein [Paenibacillus sp. LHD-117]MDQ6421994.1 LytTR family transcriptional regulator DNA-binding domain-containing protein [Paenibacillus sp. LHD-117]